MVGGDSRFIIPCLFPTLTENDLRMMSRNVTGVEVKNAMFNIGGLKAPGADGFPALFYQKHWNICASEITQMETLAFQSGKIPMGLNHTLIALVPKVSSPQDMALFRPISLCKTLYKVISKVLVARIRPYLRNLISPNQVSFVPGRHISDNIVIAQEVLHKYQHSHGGKGFMAWKIDLSKAYDRLNWGFIDTVLVEAQFPSSIVKLIMDCVSTTSFQVCLNGELTETFRASRGIRQGDPLSPYLFVLCMEKLSHLINSAVEVGQWKPVRASGSGPFISHLFFADDLILFADASCEQARILKRCLDVFCDISGQEVSYDKSVLFCSPNTCKVLAANISNICGSKLTSNLGKYLGVPLLHSRVTKRTYAPVLDKVQSRLAGWKSKMLNLAGRLTLIKAVTNSIRLAGWKSKMLSLAGRLTLIKAVTNSIPVYTMQTVRLPVSICDALDKCNRDFLWGDCNGKKKIHLANWDLVCRPKEFGRLGIKKASMMNQAMLAKIGWRMAQEDQGLWCHVLNKRYVKSVPLLNPIYSCPSGCSRTWRSIIFGVSLLKQGLSWRIGDGSSVNFWNDRWLPDGPLVQFLPDVSDIDLQMQVRDCWSTNGWNMEFLRLHFDDDIINKIVHIPPGFMGSGPDKLIWGGTANGHFTVKSAYLTLVKDENFTTFPWLFLWKLPIPSKLKSFCWLLCHGKILTNVERMKRRLTNNPMCSLCHVQDESILHLLRDCPSAMRVWNGIICLDSISRAMQLDWNGWFAANIHCNFRCYGGIKWCTVFIFSCWYIWKWRNKAIFDGELHVPFNPCKIIIDAAKEWTTANTSGLTSAQRTTVSLHWEKPLMNWIKLNVDGARNHAGMISAGGVIRDHYGSWLCGFFANSGCGTVLQAEFWGLLLGLKMSIDAHYQHVLVESDSEVLVKLMNDGVDALHPLKSVINSCQALQRQFQRCEIKHIYREVNKVADVLSKIGLDSEIGVHFMLQPPPQVTTILLDDLCETPCFRSIPCI